jgi:hypothetical protein
MSVAELIFFLFFKIEKMSVVGLRRHKNGRFILSQETHLKFAVINRYFVRQNTNLTFFEMKPLYFPPVKMITIIDTPV